MKRLTAPALILLSLIPILAGAMRVTELSGGGPVTAENARFFASPVPVVIHIVGASVYAVFGALQFDAGLRRRRPRWHRIAGRIVAPCGVAAALSGLWMAVFYPLPAGDGPALLVMRLLFGTLMAVGIVLGVVAVRRGDIRRHRAWMARAYAVAAAAGTQAVLTLPYVLLVGPTNEATRAVLMGAGWVIPLLIAELSIRPALRVVAVR
ncbi:DUF2306 domain-containing protein [Microbacteriaceae bacterium VKM Ac-2854]|nr:DUF2306 domain-containing protein [Microbacteriaceae bacterium VKM Ac-2854]